MQLICICQEVKKTEFWYNHIMKLIVSLLFFLLLSIGITTPVFAQSSTTPVEKRYDAEIISIKDERLLTDGSVKRKYQKINLIITSKEKKGEKLVIENGLHPIITTVEYEVGDKVIVSVTKDQKGRDEYFITDYIRRWPLYLLFGIFVFITAIIGGKRGIASLFGMVITFLTIFFFVLPQILKGSDPILIAIISSLFIIPINFYISHGFNKKTTISVIGTLISLGITGALANFFINFAHLSGFSSEEASFLESAKQGVVHMKGLLLAGIIIGAVGVLDDITISQAAIVFQLKKASENLNFWQLFTRAMDVGRDHIASMVNTLILVYTGAALPLLLLFSNSPLPFEDVLNYELIAEEIVRTLVVSTGLILAVPIVTFIAALVCDQDVKRATREILKSLK